MTLCVLWVCALAFLMMGGLVRESDAEVSSFTLALPVSRVRLTGVRIGVGLLQAALLAVIPWAVMLLCVRLAGGSPSIVVSGYYVTLLLGGGTLFFAIALLLSCTIHGTYTAPLLTLLASAGVFAACSAGPLRSWNPWLLMTGLPLIVPRIAAPAGPLPWLHLGITSLTSAFLICLSVVAIQKQDF
jgi:hypothetical protein